MTELLTDQSSTATHPTMHTPMTAEAPPAPPPPRTGPGDGSTPRGRWGRLVLGPTGDPRWARPALWALLAVTAVLYLWNLSASGYANDYYAAAVKSGTESWKAWLFGSLDSGNSITVDKPPAAMWVMVLSSRIFGFSSFAMLAPQALMGVGTVATLYAAVKRWSGPAAGLVAGGLLAITPVAALMFRFNNPDALLVLLLTLAGYFVVRAIETPVGRTALRWLVFAGIAVGFAFLTKMMQGLLLLPAFTLAYVVAGRSGLWTRIWHLLAAGAAVVVSGGWYVLLVALWPADSRPYIGGSQTNSLWELAIGYNGLSRIFGGSGNGGGAAPGGAAAGGAAPGGGGGIGGGGFGGSTGLGRMFGSSFGTEISWLIPAALIGLVAGLWFTRRLPRTDKIRAALMLWGGSLIVTGLVFSFMEGTIHPYYAIALAPSIAALVAITGRELWRGRQNTLVRSVLAVMIAATGVWSFVLLGRDATWLPWLRWVVLIGSVLGAVLLVLSVARFRRLAIIGLLVGSLTALSGTAAYTVATAATPHTGSIPTSGPTGSAIGGPGGFGGAAGAGGFGGRRDGSRAADGGTTAQGTLPDDLAEALASGQIPADIAEALESGQLPTGAAAGGFGGGAAGSGFGGPAGGGQGASTNSELIALLNATTTRWSAAVTSAQTAAGYILATDTAVMGIGGFTGSDPSPTLAQFQAYVAAGDISYFIAGGAGGGGFGGGGPGGSSGSGSEIQAWVEANFSGHDGRRRTTVYDLTADRPPWS